MFLQFSESEKETVKKLCLHGLPENMIDLMPCPSISPKHILAMGKLLFGLVQNVLDWIETHFSVSISIKPDEFR